MLLKLTHKLRAGLSKHIKHMLEDLFAEYHSLDAGS